MDQNFSTAIDLLNDKMNAVLDHLNGSMQYITSEGKRTIRVTTKITSILFLYGAM